MRKHVWLFFVLLQFEKKKLPAIAKIRFNLRINFGVIKIINGEMG